MSADHTLLGTYLKDRRSKLDPATFGYGNTRRRTAGLRREEVAQRADISVTWYTWLEQGRGGAASEDVLDRIAQALMMTEAEREHLFLLGLGHAPQMRFHEAAGVTPRLQRILDAFAFSPALLKTPTWDVVAWNRAASVVLTDYGSLPPKQRNILRLIFSDPRVRAAQADWEGVARFVVSAFRADITRAGATAHSQSLVEELCQSSAAFAALWRDNDVRHYGAGIKRLSHPMAGPIAFEYSAFHVDGRPDLSMIVYHPAHDADLAAVKTLVATGT